jgi:hypothetical protein
VRIGFSSASAGTSRFTARQDAPRATLCGGYNQSICFSATPYLHMPVKKPTVKARQPRNLVALAATQRKAGAHQKTNSALRKQQNQTLKSKPLED